MKALLEEAAKVQDVQEELGANYNSLITNINTAWENGGRNADDKLRRIGTNTQRDPGNPGQAEQPRGPGPWASGYVSPDGPQELAKQFLSFGKFSQEEKIKWIQKGLNIYVQQRNSRWFVVGGYNLSSLIEDGHKSPQTDRILGDFLHNHPGNGLSINSNLESLARHLNSNIVDPMVKDIKTKDLVITKGAQL